MNGRQSIHISRQQTDAEKSESIICKIVAAIIPASKRYSVPNRVIKLKNLFVHSFYLITNKELTYYNYKTIFNANLTTERIRMIEKPNR